MKEPLLCQRADILFSQNQHNQLILRKSLLDARLLIDSAIRKVTKSKTVFPSDDSLLKMLYLATMDITKKWTGHRQDWGQIHSQLEIYFEERLIGRNL